MIHKRTIYQCSQPIANGVVLCSNFRNRSHLLLSEKAYTLYSGDDESLRRLATESPQIYERLVKGGFLVDKCIDEEEDYRESVDRERKDPSFFQIIVNPTLDCNLACWYCYETKVAGSKISPETEDAICRLMERHHAEAPYRLLKLSFFGGEPFKCPDTIRRLALNARDFCENNGVELLLDFTTNGTLLTESMLKFLSPYSCMFQITLDGGSERHNKVKFSPERNIDTFATTIRNIHRIQKFIPDSSVSVRINFDKETLNDFGEIFNEIKDLDRRRTKIIIKKVWQVDSESISGDYVSRAIDRLIEADFIVDYYSQGGVCFADRDNQVTVNYDGNVFRCTTIPDFDDKNALGRLNNDGSVCWDENKTLYLRDRRFPERCSLCRMLPSCGGPCRLKAFSDADDSCFLDDIHMTVEQYALLQFRFEITKHRLYVPEKI